MHEHPWGQVFKDAENLALDRARAATEPEFNWVATPGLLVAAGEFTECPVTDGALAGSVTA